MEKTKKLFVVSLLAVFGFCSALATANEDTAMTQLESLKKQALKLNRDLFILEEDLLYPASTQLSVFLSMDVGEFFQLDAVEVKLDGKTVASHLYTERQVSALLRGGIQQIYTGNIKNGDHELTAIFTGYGPKERAYKRATNYKFTKEDETTQVELIIQDSTKKYQPEFLAKPWEN